MRFARADRNEPLAARDLEAFAMSAYMLGRDENYLRALERAHQAHLEGGDELLAARCAFWIGLRQMFRGEKAQASGWFGRAERLIAGEQRECVERGSGGYGASNVFPGGWQLTRDSSLHRRVR